MSLSHQQPVSCDIVEIFLTKLSQSHRYLVMNKRIANHQETKALFDCSHAPVGLLLQKKKGFVEKADLLQRLHSKEKSTADQAKGGFLCALAMLTFSLVVQSRIAKKKPGSRRPDFVFIIIVSDKGLTGGSRLVGLHGKDELFQDIRLKGYIIIYNENVFCAPLHGSAYACIIAACISQIPFVLNDLQDGKKPVNPLWNLFFCAVLHKKKMVVVIIKFLNGSQRLDSIRKVIVIENYCVYLRSWSYDPAFTHNFSLHGLPPSSCSLQEDTFKLNLFQLMIMISIVVLNYNGRRYLDDCLSSLAAQTFRDFEVIVVDNASTDGSVEHIKANFPWVRLVINKKNLGFAEGTNSGIRAAEGELILTFNNDARADRRLLEYLHKPMADSKVGVCAAKMLLADGRINSTGICLSRSGAAWDRGMFEPDLGQYDAEEEVFGACAGAALYRKKMLDEIGLFDEDFFIYIEDVDLAFRARLAGWSCIYVPKAKVFHHHGGTAGAGSDLSVYYGNRNIIWYAIKDFPARLLITSLPFILARNVAVIPYYALRGQGRVILKSKLDALLGIPKVLSKRQRVQRLASSQEMGRFIKTWSKIKRP